MPRRFGAVSQIPASVATLKSSTTSTSSTSSDFLNITGGISAILAPLASFGVSVYQTQQMQKLEKARLKAEAAAQSAMAAMSMPPSSGPAQSSNSGLVIGVVVGGAALLGLLVFVLAGKKDQSSGSGAAPSMASTSYVAPAPAAPPRIKRIKRSSRPKQSY